MKILMANLKIFIFLIIVTGVIYPLIVSVISQSIFSHEANGSLIVRDGQIIGSELIAQDFKGHQYFWPRPSAINFDASSSGASNLSPSSKMLKEQILQRALENGLNPNGNDSLLYASGSGLDPHIDPVSAFAQIERIANARHLDALKKEILKTLLVSQIEKREFGILGKERVNVLKLNLLMDKKL